MTRRDFLRTTSAAVAAASTVATAMRLEAQAPTNGRRSTDVVIFLYDRMTALDAIGPYEVLRCVPGVRVRFVAKTAGLVKPDSGLQMLNAEYGIADVTSADILLVPGGDASGRSRIRKYWNGSVESTGRRRGRPRCASAR